MRESVAAPVAASAPGVGDSGRARGARAAAAAAAIELGVDVGTYRLLEQLQFGNITPEDYELLLALHAPANTQTLDFAAIERIPRVVAAAADARRERDGARGRHVHDLHVRDRGRRRAAA